MDTEKSYEEILEDEDKFLNGEETDSEASVEENEEMEEIEQETEKEGNP